MTLQRPTMIDSGSKIATITQPPLRLRESKTLPVREHTVKSGKISVLDSPPASPARKWAGVPHDLGDILYLRADSLKAVHEWLIAKGLGKINEDEEFQPVGCYVDTIGDITLEPGTYDNTNPEKPIQLTRPVMAGGFHVNVRLL